VYALGDVLIFGSPIVVYGIGLFALTPQVESAKKKRLKWLKSQGRTDSKSQRTADIPFDWLWGAAVVGIARGGLMLIYWYLASQSSTFPTNIPAPNPDDWLVGLGGLLWVASVTLALSVGRFIIRPETRLVEQLSASGLIRFANVFTEGVLWIAPIVAISSTQYIWGTALYEYVQILYLKGLSAFAPVGWILFGALILNFVGWGILTYGFLPFTPLISKRRMGLGLLLWGSPLIVVGAFAALVLSGIL
jgi:hypothetical protein